MNNIILSYQSLQNIGDRIDKKAFTLVELIVVITILAILWTIAFLSMSWYLWRARDTNRITDIKNISDWLMVYYAKSWTYPIPENNVIITWSWIILRYQWFAWSNTLSFINLSSINQWKWKDPKTWEYYTYILDSYRTQIQLVWYFESLENLWYNKNNKFIDQVNAWYIWWHAKFFWDELGVVMENEKLVNEITSYVWNSIDIRYTQNTYKIKYNYNDFVTWTWNILFASMYNRDKNLLRNKDLAILDESLVWFWDMETMVSSWSQIVLKDFSKWWNNWVCYDISWWNIVNCWEWNWPKKEMDYMTFDWNDFV